MTLGQIIKQYRDRTGMSRARFSEISGLSQSYIGALEKNSNPVSGKKINPSMKAVEVYSRVCNANTADGIQCQLLIKEVAPSIDNQ
jgi:transcriptional regulator with XRE-family HTH domain